MKKSFATFLLSLSLLAACQSPQPSAPETPTGTASLSETEIVAQITEDFLATHPNEPAPQVELFESVGDTRYYSANPDGLGGYILYSGAMNLYSYTDGQSQVKVEEPTGEFVTDLSSDGSLALGFALFEGPQGSHIGAVVTDLKTGKTSEYLVDASTQSLQAGAGIFSPDDKELAFAVTETDSGEEKTLIYVVNLDTGAIAPQDETQLGAVQLSWENGTLKVK